MKIMLNVLKKDLREFWPLLLLWLAATLFSDFMGLRPAAPGFGFLEIFYFLPGWTLWLCFFPTLVQLDRPTGASSFWMTRPISAGRLYLVKMIELVVYAVAIPVAVHGLFLFSQGFSIGDVRAPLTHLVQGTLVSVGLTFFLASLTRSMAQFWLFVIGLFVSFTTAINLFIHHLTKAPHSTNELSVTRFILGLVLFPLAGAVLAGLQYRHRRITYGIATGALTAVGLFFLCSVWPWPIPSLVGLYSELTATVTWKAEPFSLKGPVVKERRGVVEFPLQLPRAQEEGASFTQVEGETLWSTGMKTATNGPLPEIIPPEHFSQLRAAVGDGYALITGQPDKDVVLKIPLATGSRAGAFPLRFGGALRGIKTSLRLLGKCAVLPGVTVQQGGRKFMIDETPLSGGRHQLIARYQCPTTEETGLSDGGIVVVLVDTARRAAQTLSWSEQGGQRGLSGFDRYR